VVANDRVLVVDEAEAGTVARIPELAAEDKSLRQILAILEGEGQATEAGCQVAPADGRAGDPAGAAHCHRHVGVGPRRYRPGMKRNEWFTLAIFMVMGVIAIVVYNTLFGGGRGSGGCPGPEDKMTGDC
jgi:hypothetical protein